MRRQRRSTPPVRLSALFFGLSIGLIAAACSPVPSNSPNESRSSAPNGSPSAAPTEVPGTSAEPSGSAGPGEPTQTDTAWGRIWDAVPASYPKPDGAIDSDPIERQATSGDLSVGASPEDVKSFYEVALKALGYVVSSQGPLENGGWVIDASPGGACKTEVTVTPLSGVAHVAIMYGAACPFR